MTASSMTAIFAIAASCPIWTVTWTAAVTRPMQVGLISDYHAASTASSMPAVLIVAPWGIFTVVCTAFMTAPVFPNIWHRRREAGVEIVVTTHGLVFWRVLDGLVLVSWAFMEATTCQIRNYLFRGLYRRFSRHVDLCLIRWRFRGCWDCAEMWLYDLFIVNTNFLTLLDTSWGSTYQFKCSFDEDFRGVCCPCTKRSLLTHNKANSLQK